MIEQHCVECGTRARPKEYHPSSLRTELAVWLIALLFWGGFGAVTSLRSAQDTPDHRRLQLSTVIGDAPAITDASAEPASRTGAQTSLGELMHWTLKATHVLETFVHSAWWILAFPLMFSLYRQFNTWTGCAYCRSKNLKPVPSPFDGL